MKSEYAYTDGISGLKTVSDNSGWFFSNDDSGYRMCELVVEGKAFLWHQVRCLVAILMMIGEGKEKPEVGRFIQVLV